MDALAFETLIPKSIVQRYVSLLVEHRRIILCGPGGTGKTFLAHRLAEYLVLRSVVSHSCNLTAALLRLIQRCSNIDLLGVAFMLTVAPVGLDASSIR